MKTVRADRVREVRDHPQPISRVLQALLQHLGIARKLQQYGVLMSWESIVGEQIARVSVARKIENGILFVDVKTASWRHELAMRKPEIMEKIHRTTGKKILKDIRFH